MFRPNCRAIFRLIFEEMECTIDNAFNLRDLVLQELVKIDEVCHIKDVRLKLKELHHHILVRKNPTHCTPQNHPVNFTLSIFNAYCTKKHI
jgi:hypothetical protein